MGYSVVEYVSPSKASVYEEANTPSVSASLACALSQLSQTLQLALIQFIKIFVHVIFEVGD